MKVEVDFEELENLLWFIQQKVKEEYQHETNRAIDNFLKVYVDNKKNG